MKTLQKKSRHCKSFAVTTPNIVSLINNGHRPNARKQVGTTKTTVSFLKNITFFLSFLILGFGSELKAQESPKWEIGTDLLWLVGKNSLPDYSLFSRWHYNPNRALRIRIGTDVQTNPIRPRKVFKANFMIRLGHEWSKQIAKKTDLFGGLEAHYQKDEIQSWLIPAPQALPFYFPDYSWQIGGVAFIGCRYFINRNFSFSVESSIKGAHRVYGLNSYSGGLVLVTPDNFVLEGGALKFLYQTPIKGAVFEIKPIQVLNFSYHF